MNDGVENPGDVQVELAVRVFLIVGISPSLLCFVATKHRSAITFLRIGAVVRKRKSIVERVGLRCVREGKNRCSIGCYWHQKSGLLTFPSQNP